MIRLSNKAKHLLLLIGKLLVVSVAFYFMYVQLQGHWAVNWELFLAIFAREAAFFWLFMVVFLSFLNRFLEVLKWQNLVYIIKKLSVLEAFSQVLAALAVGVFTPNGVGEYAAKALYFKKSETKTVLFLNLLCNGIQMLYTILFGVCGFLYFNYKFVLVSSVVIGKIALLLLLFLLVFLLLKKFVYKNFSFFLFFNKIARVPKNRHAKNALFGLFRYLVFTHQYYLLLYLFGIGESYFMLIATITMVYLVASSLPSFQFLDVAIKGSVAIYFFNFVGVAPVIIALISTIMWILNSLIPVLLGLFFVVRYSKPKE